MEDPPELPWITTLFLLVSWCTGTWCRRTENVTLEHMAESRKTSGFQGFFVAPVVPKWVCLGNWRTQIRLSIIVIIVYNHTSWTWQFWAKQFLDKSIYFILGHPGFWNRAVSSASCAVLAARHTWDPLYIDDLGVRAVCQSAVGYSPEDNSTALAVTGSTPKCV